MRPIVRRQLAAVTPIAIAAVCLSGCGSGSTGQISVSALTASSKSQATGRAVFKVTWPVRLVANGRLIPVLSNSIRVDVKNSTGTVASQLLVCPYPVAPGGQVGVLTFASLPVGNYTVVATALPNADGSGTAQATGNVQTTVTADATTTFSLTMQSTIDHIALAAANPATTLPATITVGDTLALVALAVDASGSTVLTNLTWTATAPDTGAPSTVATVDSNGLVTSLLTGSVTITATDPESGKFASTLVTVGAVPPPILKYTATDIGTPGGKYTLSGIATMNASGQVASSWVGPNFGNELGHAFLYTPGSGFKDLGNIGDDVQVYAQNINDAGQVVGYADNSSQNPNTPDAFLYSTDPMTNLTPPSTYYSGTASGINNSGQVVGYLRVGQFDTPNAFVYSGGTIQTLGGFGGQATDSEAYAINASGQIVGSAAAGSGYHAFLYSGGTMQDLGVLPGFAVSRASAVNSSGQVVGICNNFVGLPITYQGFLYSGGKMQNIATLAGTSVYTMTPKSINDAGQIVGQMQQAVGNNTHAFVYASGGLYDLNDITTGLNGVVLDEAGTIINNGSIVASGVNNGTEHVMVLTPVSGSKAATAIRTSARR